MITKEQRDFMPGYFLTHDAIRKDLRRLRAFAERSSHASSTDRETLARWLSRVHEYMIMTHHHAEDEFFIPKLLALVPSFQASADTIVHEHHVLDARMAELKQAIAGTDAGALSGAIHAYADVVERHLAAEEPVVITTVMGRLTKSEFMALEKEHQKHGSIKDLAVGVPWALDVMTDEEFQAMKRSVPAPMFYVLGLLNLLFWKPAYQRLIERLPAA